MSTQAVRLNTSENNRGRGWKELEGEKEHKRQTIALLLEKSHLHTQVTLYLIYLLFLLM